MGRVVKKIVLTGGPCAGKSSSLDLIKDYLKKKGYVVLIVQESATEFINSGIRPFGDNNLSMVDFQGVLLKYQLEKEQIIEDIAMTFYDDKDIVLIYDRAIIDYKAYINETEFNKLMNKYSLNEKDILNKYDLIVHLETAAKSNAYMTSNNKARSESVDEAIILDNKTYNAWIHHNNLIKVNSYENFIDKQNEIIRIIDKFM